MRYLALGDSYTIGEGVEPRDRWPNVLCDRLTRAGFSLQPPRIVATTGWTTDELSAAMDSADLQSEYDLVSLLIGVNNQYRGRSCVTFAAELDALITRAMTLARRQPKRVILISIPDWTVTPFFATTERELACERDAMATYNRACRKAAEAAGTQYVDITAVSNAMADNEQLVTDDGLHPSAALYRTWVDQIYPVARAVLADSP